ncbi:MAG TPA: hypothetical protein VGQ83_28850, partial [Polyangia bacterium]
MAWRGGIAAAVGLVGVLAAGGPGCSRPRAPEARPRVADAAAAAAPASAPAATMPASVAATPAGAARRTALLEEAGRAELIVGGPFIDLGTADQHKYTRGGWLTGWGRDSTGADGVTALGVTEAAPRLTLLLDRERPRSVAVRARSAVPGQTVRLVLDGVELG